ncbi:raf homolog serine/threonine-protein kinase Raf [Adelges cooleyi]|uniref:raf homolog serine/threonine-protein kinase Raf n=1 Tax=Adelges cooleyi TaxID=133065 RepID=UPI0021801FA6|nr:raf homolog serine/threonine-protein kinase Raf [Adelges cooleyi]
MSFDFEEINSLRHELQNVREVMRLTKCNIEELNGTFATFDHPPAIYLTEYRELTVKLHELEAKEQQLLDQVDHPREHRKTGRADKPSTPSVRVIRAHLPNKQRTTIEVKHGETLHLALEKRLQHRKIPMNVCVVYRHGTNHQIPWDTQTSAIEYDEIQVKMCWLPIQASFTHDFSKRTSFTTCDHCRQLLFQGYHCRSCGFKFHERCSMGVPVLCIPTRDLNNSNSGNHTIYQNSAGILQLSSDYESSRRRVLVHGERSSSEPNVCRNMVNMNWDDLAELKRVPSGVPQGYLPHSQSAQASPTNVLRTRPRSKSDDESATKKRLRDTGPQESLEDWEIPETDIQLGDCIGSGSFGTVYKANWHGPVAIKALKVKQPTAAQLQAFKNEVSVLKKTRHVNVLLFMGVIRKPNLAIVTQWCEGSSLYRCLHVLEKKFETMQLISITGQTAIGMNYLHSKSIIHRDLKSNNIFFNDSVVKIGDFGLATIKSKWSGGQQYHQPSGSILWMAPEVIRMKEDNPYSFQSDVYAYGVVLYELLSGQLPYTEINNKDQILFMVGRGSLRPDQKKVRTDAPAELRKLMENCIKFAREDRPKFKDIAISIQNIIHAMPKLQRTTSEPILCRSNWSDDYLYPSEANNYRGAAGFI